MRSAKRILAFACICVLAIEIVNAQSEDSLQKKKLFELSFGQSMLFISNSKVIDLHAKEALVVPTSSILFFIELRPHKKMRVPVFFNLPTETKQFLVNGQLVNERANPTFGTGLQFRIAQIKIDAKSKIEFEAGPLASVLMDSKNHWRFAPIVAGRVRILRGDNFVMYLGASYSVGINTWGLLYGTGTVF